MEKMDLKSFWQGKPVLVTGHTGFKGSWMIYLLKELGAKPFGYSLAPDQKPNLYSQIKISEHCEEFIGDIRSAEKVRSFLQTSKPEIVLHMAAQPLVRRSYQDPVETYSTNVVGTATVLDEIRKFGSVKATVVITTDKCYENREWSWGYRENDRLGGKDPYSASKACTEIVAKSFYHSFFEGHGLALATARAGNVIGGGDFSEDRIVPDLMRSLELKSPLVLRSPDSVRPWQHVIEPLVGYLKLAQEIFQTKDLNFESFNFGPDKESCVSVMSLIRQFQNHISAPLELKITPDNVRKESRLLMLDNSKAGDLLNWKPRWNIETTAQKTMEWYGAYLERKDLSALTRRQIQEYLNQV